MKFLKKVFRPALYFIAASAFTACETVVEMPIPEHVPKLAVRYMLGNVTPDSLEYAHFPQYQAYVSHSQSVFATQPLDGLNNATITVTDAGQHVVETFERDPASRVGAQANGYYQPVTNFTGTPGAQYTLTVQAPGYESVSATLSLPATVSGLQGTFTPLFRGPAGPVSEEITGNLSITFPDNGAENNYYIIYGVLLDNRMKANARDIFREKEAEEGLGLSTDFKDIHFSTMGYEAVRPFDDKTFNGTTLTFSKPVSLLVGDAVKQPKFLRVYLHSVTPDTYRFLKSLNAYYDNGSSPFSEATRVIGNMKQGYGYFGGYTSTYTDIPL